MSAGKLTEAEREALGKALMACRWPDGGFEGMPTNRTSVMIAEQIAPAIEAILAEREASLRAQIAASAWDEGYTSGHSNAMRRMSDEPNAPTTPNPYTRIARGGDGA